ncbi:hypothetical protein ABMY35_09885 [Pseudoalteromonas sp. BZB3]|uniref:hypothetical protein n=1 Tax=Pseudoalteromonas sp. BZB3 TaxID=3136670 RepID=UPI0032C4A81E
MKVTNLFFFILVCFLNSSHVNAEEKTNNEDHIKHLTSLYAKVRALEAEIKALEKPSKVNVQVTPSNNTSSDTNTEKDKTQLKFEGTFVTQSELNMVSSALLSRVDSTDESVSTFIAHISMIAGILAGILSLLVIIITLINLSVVRELKAESKENNKQIKDEAQNNLQDILTRAEKQNQDIEKKMELIQTLINIETTKTIENFNVELNEYLEKAKSEITKVKNEWVEHKKLIDEERKTVKKLGLYQLNVDEQLHLNTSEKLHVNAGESLDKKEFKFTEKKRLLKGAYNNAELERAKVLAQELLDRELSFKDKCDILQIYVNTLYFLKDENAELFNGKLLETIALNSNKITKLEYATVLFSYAVNIYPVDRQMGHNNALNALRSIESKFSSSKDVGILRILAKAMMLKGIIYEDFTNIDEAKSVYASIITLFQDNDDDEIKDVLVRVRKILEELNGDD